MSKEKGKDVVKPPSTPNGDEKGASALSKYFQVNLHEVYQNERPPLPPRSPSKNASQSHQYDKTLAGSARNLGQHGHEGQPTTRPSTSSGHPAASGPSTSGAAAASTGKARSVTKSAGVAAALDAVLNKSKNEGIRGLSAAPDESLSKDKVNKDVLQKMRETFQNADADGTGQLSMDEFVDSFQGVLQTEDGNDADALRKLFMRIDANSDATIDWDEFSSFMLLESQGSANLRDLEHSISFENPDDWAPPDGSGHSKLITHISQAVLPTGAYRYITCSKDGTVKVWNTKDLKVMRTIQVGNSWVTCAKMLPTTKKLAVTSFSRCMKIFDLQTYELCGQIPEIEYAPMSMDVWSPSRKRDVELVAFGDGGGYVRLYELKINPLEDKTSHDRYLDSVKWKHQRHTDWVTCVKYVEELHAVLAGSLDKYISITDAEDRVSPKALAGHVKGVTCLDWSPAYKFIVSGGVDRRLMLWNPFSLKPLATLNGHLASVTAVMVNERDNQIVSVSADKHVKLWDIRNHKCIQTLTDREVVVANPEEDTLSTAHYDSRRKLLVTGALWPKLWRQTITAAASCGHKSPVTKVMYNSLFNEAVSADQAGTISVWFVPTGKLRFRFENTHPGQALTALAFDGAKRRLLTGADNGDVKVWNFSSGACLCVLRPKTHDEVTCITTIRGALFKQFVVAGWDRKVTCYEDPGPTQKETWPGRALTGHQADILDMAVMDGGHVLVSVSDDGEVLTWNMESGSCRRRATPPGQSELPMNQQAIERVAFMSGKLHHVFVTIGADRWLRFWDGATSRILLERFTSHMLGETIQGLALHPCNEMVATGDGSGLVKVWDTSAFTGAEVLKQSDVRNLVPETAMWRAHRKGITSMDWVDAGHSGQFILSSSMDRTVSLWSVKGAFVGQFSAHVWLLDTPQTWRSTRPYPLDQRDQSEQEIARQVPKRHLYRGDTNILSLGSQTSSPMASPRMMFGDGVPSAMARGGAHLMESPSISPRRVNITAPMTAKESVDGRQGQDMRHMVAGKEQPQQQGLNYDPTAAAGGSMCGNSMFGSRPTTAPSEIAKILEQSAFDRLKRMNSVRRVEKPEEYEPGGRYSRAGSLVARSGGSSFRSNVSKLNMAALAVQNPQDEAGSDPATATGAAKGEPWLYDDEDPEEEDGDSQYKEDSDIASESSDSSDHTSDEDVPRGLWLHEFNMARKLGPKGLISDAAGARRDASVYQPHRAGRRKEDKAYNTGSSAGRKEGSVAHLMHVSGLSPVGRSPVGGAGTGR